MTHTHARRPSRLLSTLALGLLLVGCGASDDQSGGSEGAIEAAAAAEPPVDPVANLLATDPLARFATELGPRLRDLLVTRAEKDDFQHGLEARLATARAHAEKRASVPPDKREPIDLYYDETLTSWYGGRGFAPAFTRRGQLTPAARAALEVMKQAASHGLDPTDYWLEDLERLATEAASLSDSLIEAPGLELSEREALGLAAWLEVDGRKASDPALEGDVVEMLLAEGADNPLPRVRGAYDLYRERQAALLELAVDLEVHMADAYTRYVRDMRAANLNRLTAREIERFGEEPHPKHHSTIVLDRLVAELMAFATVTTEAQATEWVDSLAPPNDQYAKLRAAYERYQAIVAEGGWPSIEPVEIRKGNRAPQVSALKRRLAAEGYFEGTVDDDFFDDALGDAIALYQETHQMEVTGEPTRVFWRSVNISAEDRTEEIRVNLARFREARFVPSDYYVYINVPDFHAEVWRDGERVFRTRIVVGNTTKRCDASTGKWYFPNATPLQHARLDHVVFNPYWNVPLRIAREEYQAEIARNPRWLEENGFEYHTASDGTVLRQVPGPDNALGKVKFIFPNKHNTYMHDTPKQALFAYPVRAFSHGCMRVEDPMDLAETLLSPEKKWDDKKIWGLLKQRSETRIDLDRPLDVFIEYFTVRVDEFGRTHFLADIYKYVYYEIHPPTSAALRCDPAGGEDAVIPGGPDYGP